MLPHFEWTKIAKTAAYADEKTAQSEQTSVSKLQNSTEMNNSAKKVNQKQNKARYPIRNQSSCRVRVDWGRDGRNRPIIIKKSARKHVRFYHLNFAAAHKKVQNQPPVQPRKVFMQREAGWLIVKNNTLTGQRERTPQIFQYNLPFFEKNSRSTETQGQKVFGRVLGVRTLPNCLLWKQLPWTKHFRFFK